MISNRSPLVFSWLFSASLFVFLSCSVPNLEKPECTDSRLSVKQFYSYHFGNDMVFSQENLKLRQKYLAPELYENLKSAGDPKFDYFTQTGDFPKAFRVGSCSVIAADQTNLEVLLFWKSETESLQQAVTVATRKINDQWLIEKIENKN